MSNKRYDVKLDAAALSLEPTQIIFLLPGFAPNPVGGYKVVYEYANGLVALGYSVKILQSWRFSGAPQAPLKTFRFLRNLRHFQAVRLNTRPSWFDLDPRVTLTNHFQRRTTNIPPALVAVATAAQTAPAVQLLAERHGVAGVYLIQHFENWAVSDTFLTSTWLLPLRRVVIAPWLQEIGRRLGVESTVVANAVDPLAFPLGAPIADRPLSVVAMISPMVFKRSDLVCEVFDELKRLIPGVEGTTFGVSNRPKNLPSYVTHHKLPTGQELQSLYAEARVYFCASDSEGWHLPGTEAMASGAAFVSTDNGGVRAYADGVAKFTAVGDGLGIAASVHDLLRDETENQRLATAGAQRVLTYGPSDAVIAFAAEIRAAIDQLTCHK